MGLTPPPINRTAQVYFDVDIGGEKAGRIVFELSADVVPKTAGKEEEAWWW